MTSLAKATEEWGGVRREKEGDEMVWGESHKLGLEAVRSQEGIEARVVCSEAEAQNRSTEKCGNHPVPVSFRFCLLYLLLYLLYC